MEREIEITVSYKEAKSFGTDYLHSIWNRWKEKTYIATPEGYTTVFVQWAEGDIDLIISK